MAYILTKDAFLKAFKLWPSRSLAYTNDHPRSGSNWDEHELETFQILRSNPDLEFPKYLQRYLNEAKELVGRNPGMTSAVDLLQDDWRNFKRCELNERAGEFASFFVLLAQIMDTSTVESRPELRQRGQAQVAKASESDSDSSYPSSPPSFPQLSSSQLPQVLARPTSPTLPPVKRTRYEPPSSESYIPSDPSDQSSYNLRNKPEIVTNCCIYMLLNCVMEALRKPENTTRVEERVDPQLYLEWNLASHSFTIKAAKTIFTTINDGSLVAKTRRGGCWTQASDICYCSIEVSS